MLQQSLARLLVFILAATTLATPAYSQAPSLQEQLNALNAQYKSVQIGADGAIVRDPGTLLALQKGGIIAVAWKALAECPAKFHDNELHPRTVSGRT